MWVNLIGVIVLLEVVTFSAALYEGCDNTYYLEADKVAYLESPYYPNRYPSGTSCRYMFIAPLDYEIVAECTMAIDKVGNTCTTEALYIARDGDPYLRGSEYLCGTGSETTTSLFRTLVMAYWSKAPPNTAAGGTFNCKLTTRPQACDCGWSQNKRIVGGVDATINEFPSMVGLYHVRSKRIFCGGTIINHRTVLTAAHCTSHFASIQDLLIMAGDHNISSTTETRYAVTYKAYKFIDHPQYDADKDLNDIAIIITATNMEWSQGVGPICLPLDQLTNTFDYQPVDVVGWGTTFFGGILPTNLQKAAVNVLPNSVCKTVYPNVQPSEICTFYPKRDACQFDSGGPVIHKSSIRQFLLGIISYGYACGTNAGVNTRVTSFVNWIRTNAVGSLCYKPFL